MVAIRSDFMLDNVCLYMNCRRPRCVGLYNPACRPRCVFKGNRAARIRGRGDITLLQTPGWTVGQA